MNGIFWQGCDNLSDLCEKKGLTRQKSHLHVEENEMRARVAATESEKVGIG